MSTNVLAGSPILVADLGRVEREEEIAVPLCPRFISARAPEPA